MSGQGLTASSSTASSSSSLLSSEPGFGSWFDGCKYIYLDVGTNRGIQIRKLFEPHLYPDALVHKYFDEYFGSPEERKNREICAVGFEPNHNHAKLLKDIEQAYNAQGWKVKMFTSTAASTVDNDEVSFFSDNKVGENEVGASFTAKGAEFKVKVMDLSRYILENVAPQRHLSVVGKGRKEEDAAKVVMKVDIEGAEHTVLPHLVVTGAFCQIDLLYAELHGFNYLTYNDGGYDDNYFWRFAYTFLSTEHKTNYCHPKYVYLDDEDYGDTLYDLPPLSSS